MAAADAFMDLVEKSFHFGGVDTLQIRPSKRLLIQGSGWGEPKPL